MLNAERSKRVNVTHIRSFFSFTFIQTHTILESVIFWYLFKPSWIFLACQPASTQRRPFPSCSDPLDFLASNPPLRFLLFCSCPTPPPAALRHPTHVCLRASSRSVSEKCCCQLTFPITPPVGQTMDTLLMSGDRAEREPHTKQRTRARSLSGSLSSTIYLCIYLKCHSPCATLCSNHSTCLL